MFAIESAERALAAALAYTPAELAAASEEVRALEYWGAINGSGTPAELPPHLVEVWGRRDLSRDAHRAAYSGLARHAGLDPEQAELLYARGLSPQAWQPFDDTVEVLTRLRERDVPVALVSNIGWDPRPVLTAYGVLELFDTLVLSDERGVVKPDPEIFRQACAELGVAPATAVMIGDNLEADGGAVAIGCRFLAVDPSRQERTPRALVRAAGLEGTHG